MKCSANCQSCSRSDTCDVCAPGFGFLNGFCNICPSGTHMLSGGVCVGKFLIERFVFQLTFLLGKCSQNCQYCTNPGTCDACIPGFGLLNGACTICPSTTHTLSNGVCKGKFSTQIFVLKLIFLISEMLSKLPILLSTQYM